ncbi:DUF4347 domain-containing protein [Planctomycetes bacterium K23_9]|uniref:DUF4347 domain-containing protein n=1 Tax=Stieleria marina TaxID=1930275 RepID=A0A517P137_9BACT|nr:hypothetical protein K239x_51010 [Planctomycetes bacterium K23_9]
MKKRNTIKTIYQSLLSRRRLWEQMEDRVLFDAVVDDIDAQPAADVTDAAGFESVNVIQNIDDEIERIGTVAGARAASSASEIVFIDTGVEDLDVLLADLNQQTDEFELVFLDPTTNGLTEIANHVSGRTEIEAIHILSHGDEGRIALGNTQVTTEQLNGLYADTLDRIGASLGSDADILIYGCDLAGGQNGQEFIDTFALLTRADVAASDDTTGHATLGGDWELEYATGAIQAKVVIGDAARGAFMGTLEFLDITAVVVADGTPSFDADDSAGNDSGSLNGIVRSHDIVTIDLFYNTDSNGATNPYFEVTLPEGMVFDALPAQAALDSRSGIYDSDGVTLGGDSRHMKMYLPDISGTISSNVTVVARALGVENGTQVNDIVFHGNSDENATSLITDDDIDFTISSAANMDIRLLNPTFRGAYTDATGNIDGVVYSYGIGIFGAHPTRTGADGVKGSAPIQDPYTFDIDLTDVTPNAQVFSWGPLIGELDSHDGIGRNYEWNATTSTAWSHSGRPAGRTQEHPTSTTWSEEKSTPDSGEWTITGTTSTAAGAIFTTQVVGADTTGSHFPDYSAGGGTIPAGDNWFGSGIVHVWVPVDDIAPGEDGVLGTSDDGVLKITPKITNFDPDDLFGATNNFGSGIEDESNNSYTHTVQTTSLGGSGKRNFEYGQWKWVQTGTYWHAGDAVTSIGHQYDASVHSGQNGGILELDGVIFGDKFDNTATKIAPISDYAGANRSNHQWSRAYLSGGGPAEWLQEGVDYVVEFGTGGVDGAAGGWTDWNSMGDATLADDQTSTVWTTDPTDIASLGGTADPDSGVSDAITKFRFKMLGPLRPGGVMRGFVSLETTGPSTLDLANNPDGTIIANFLASSVGYLRDDADPNNDWRTSEYDPSDNSWFTEGSSSDLYRGDRLTLVTAQVRVDKTVVDIGSGNLFLAGSSAKIQLESTVTVPGPDNGDPADDVWVTDILPAGLSVVGGSANVAAGDTFVAGDGSIQIIEAVEYFDGTVWSSTWAYGASGIRVGFGDVPLNTTLPVITFDVLIPFDATNGETWENTAVIDSPSDISPEGWRDSQAGLVAVQVAAMATGKQVVTPLIPEDGTVVFELGVANISDDKVIPWFDAIDILPYNADDNGSSFGGSYTNVDVSNLSSDINVYVTTVAGSVLDDQDDTPNDGYSDPGVEGSSTWYVSPGTGIWQYTLDDVKNNVVGAPTMDQITGLRFVSDPSYRLPAATPHLPQGSSETWLLHLQTQGNSGIPSDTYTNKLTARTAEGVLPLPVQSPPATAVVVAPEIEIEKETCLDETGVNCDPLNDSHWGETATFDDTNEVTWRLKLVNTGTADVVASVDDVIPAGLSYVAGSASTTLGDISGFPTTWTVNVAAGQTQYVTFTTSTVDATSYTNSASVDVIDQFAQTDSDSDDASVTFVSEISVSKEQTDAVRSTTNPAHFNVTYEVELMNTSVFDLADLTLTEDIFAAFGPGYQGVVTGPAILSSTISTGGSLPTINGSFDGNLGGTGDAGIFDGFTGLLKPNDRITVTYTVAVDPLLLVDPANTTNQVEAGGATGGPGGTLVSDLSDDGDDPDGDNADYRGDDGAGGVDDPTPLILPTIDLQKEVVGSPTHAASGTEGNYDVTYQFTVTNTGTTDLDKIALTEDFAANLGGAFVGIVDGPKITSSDATDDPDPNYLYDGGATNSDVFANVPDPDYPITFGGSNESNTTAKRTVIGDQRFVINPEQSYDLSVDAFAGDGAGGNFDPASRHYIGVASYDIDGNRISPYHFMRNPGAAETTLAVELKPGDTTITLNDATGWLDGGTAHQRTLQWYGYADSTGHVYDDYTYTRNYRANLWDAGAISGNVITLRDPWTGPTLSAGDAVGNGRSGGSYQYTLAGYDHIPETSTTLTAPFGGSVNTSALYNKTQFRPGTHSISALILADYTNTGTELTVSNFTIRTANTNLLEVGQSVTVEITVEIDPDNPAAIYDGITTSSTGDLENHASISAIDPVDGTVVSDTSDDPNDSTEAEFGDDSDPDDPTAIRIPNITLNKTIVSQAIAISGTVGNKDVTYDLTITNTGSTPLDRLSLVEDLDTHFGGAFEGIVLQSGNVASIVSSTADDDPEINTAYDGGATDANLFDPLGVSLLQVGQSVTVRIIVEIDPDNASANYDSVTGDGSGDLENQATVSAIDPFDVSNTPVVDDSDDPADSANTNNNADNDPDDPTVLGIPRIQLEKTVVGVPVPSASGVNGNFDVTYQLVLTNNGQLALTNPTITDDWATQFGGAFKGIVDIDLSDDTTVPSGSGIGGNSNYTGGALENLLDGLGTLAVNESVTILVTVEVDPNDVTANLNAGSLVNSAIATGTDPAGVPVSDTSDDSTDSSDSDTDGNGDPDDPTVLRIADVNLVKAISTSTPPAKQADGTWNVTFDLTVENTGTTVLDQLSVLDDVSSSSNFGTAWQSTLGVTLNTGGLTTGDPPALNAAWFADPTQDMLDGTGSMNVNDSFTISVTVNLDPDALGSSAAGLFNQATTSAEDPSSPGTTVDDASDDPTDFDNNDPDGDHNPDDPTGVYLSDIGVAKQVESVTPIGTGKFEVVYVVVVENTGTNDLTNIVVTEDMVAEFGHGFDAVISAPTLVASDLSSGASVPVVNASWDGGLAGPGNTQLTTGSGLLKPGDGFTLMFTIEVDTTLPDGGDTTGAGDFTNTVVATADGPGGTTASDNSDAGTNPNSDNGNGTDDDPTPFQVPQIRAGKTHGTAIKTIDGTGNYIVPVTIVVANSGNVDLTNVTLIEDVAALFGNAFVSVDSMSITATGPFTGTLPTLNTNWDSSDTAIGVIDTTVPNELKSNEQFTFSFNVVVDPDEVDGLSQFNENQANVSGEGTNYDGNPVIVTDQSGDTGNPISETPDNDLPTPLVIPEIVLEKSLVSQSLATSGIAGNIDAVYQFTYTNSGTVMLTSPTIADDWAGQFGDGFVRIVDVDLSDDVIAPATSGISGNAAYNGLATDNLLDGLGAIDPGQSVVVLVTVEVDPDADPAKLVDGRLENVASAEGTYTPTTGPSVTVDDNSDDTNDVSNIDTDNDGDFEDPTPLGIADITLTKDIIGSPVPSISGTPGNFDVTYHLVVANTGSETLSNLTLFDDIDSQFGGALESVVSISMLAGSTATTAPAVNNSYDGTAASDMLIGDPADRLESGQVFTIVLVVEVDPDNAGAVYDSVTGDGNGDLENSATAGGNAQYSGNVTDVSDDTNDPSNSEDPTDIDNDPDDPTGLIIQDITLEKAAVGGPVPASSATAGNFDLTYDLTITNTGSESLRNLSLVENLAAQYGGAFVGIVSQSGTQATIVSSTANDVPEINAAYDGGATDAQLFDNSAPNANLLRTGESVTVRIVIEVDPNAPGAILVDDGLENQASVAGTGVGTGQTTEDLSDDPADTANDDGDPSTTADDDNNPDDPNVIRIPDITLLKQKFGAPSNAASGTPGNMDVFYDLTIVNSGTTPLEELSLVENLSSQFGGAFVQIVPQSGQVATILGTATDAPELNASYDGGLTTGNDQLFDSSGANTSLLAAGESITVRLLVEIDPDNAGASYDSVTADGTNDLENLATVAGEDPADPSNTLVTDVSDDPTDPTGDANDPTVLAVPDIQLQKSIVGSPVPAVSGTQGHFDVTYQFTITNDGQSPLSALKLSDDFAAQFGGAFVRLVPQSGSPVVITASTASDDPEINTAYDGDAVSEMFNNSGTNSNQLLVGQSVTVQVIVEIDPDNAGATYDGITGDSNQDLENQAQVSGEDPDGLVVVDLSDDPADTSDNDTTNDGEPDDPTALIIPDITLEKTPSGEPVPASSLIEGNFDITYDLTITNTGNDPLHTISLLEDLRSQYGSAFIDIVGTPLIVASTATDDPGINGSFDGGFSDDEIFDSSAAFLDISQSVTVRVVIEVDPDATDAIYIDGNLENQAEVSATGQNSAASVDDLSDDPANPDNVDESATPGGDNNPDDPNLIRIPNITLHKVIDGAAVAASSGVFANYDVTYKFTVTNTGTTMLENLRLTDDWAAQFGNAFVRIIPGSVLINNVDAATAPGANASYTGGASENMFDGSGSFTAGQSFEVSVTVELDPNAAGAIYTNGDLVNQADMSGVDPTSGATVSDQSDDVNDSTNVDGDASTNGDDDNNPDDPTVISFSDIGAAKRIVSSSPASGAGDLDLVYELRVRNLGSTDLTNLTLVDDLQTLLGPSFVGMVSQPIIIASSATIDPVLDASYDGNLGGSGNISIFDGTSGLLKPGEEIVVQYTLALDVDQLTATSNNQAVSGGNDGTLTVTDPSDTGVDPEGNNPGQTGDTGGEDDPTLPPGVAIAKNHGDPVPAGPNYQEWSVPVTLVIRNVGVTDLTNLDLTEDIATSFGTAFVSVDLPQIDVSGITSGSPPSINAAWTNDTSLNMLAGGSLRPGDEFVVTFNVIVDPDAGGTAQPLNNQSAIVATDPANPSVIVRDTSDSGKNATSDNPDEPGDSGGTEDPTPLQIPDIGTGKQIVNVEMNGLQATLTIDLVLENTGTVDLESLTLQDDFADQYGGNFVGITGAPIILSSTATTDPALNADFDGSSDIELFDGASGLLQPGEQIVVRLSVLVKALPGQAEIVLENQAVAGGDPVDENGDPITDDAGNPVASVTDNSDSGSDPHSSNPGQPGDTGTWGDPTLTPIKFFTFDGFNNFSKPFGHPDSERPGSRLLTKEIWQLAVDPMFSGSARPGTKIVGRLYDQDGFQIGQEEVFADVGGNWMMQVHELDKSRNTGYARVEFEEIGGIGQQFAPSGDAFGYLGQDKMDNDYAALEPWTPYEEHYDFIAIYRGSASVKLATMHRKNNQSIGFGTQSE